MLQTIGSCTQKCYQQIWKTQQWPQDWKLSVFIPIPKKSRAKECSNYWTMMITSHASKLVLKILQARFQQWLNRKLSNVQAEFRKSRGTRDQITNILDHRESQEFQKSTDFRFNDYVKGFDCVDHNKLRTFFKKMGLPETILPVSWETYIRVKKQQLELEVKRKSLSHVLLFVTPIDIQPMEFSRPKYGSG